MMYDLRIYDHKAVITFIDAAIQALKPVVLLVAILFLLWFVIQQFRERVSRSTLLLIRGAVLTATTAFFVVWGVKQPSELQERWATNQASDEASVGDAWWQKDPLATEDEVREYLLEQQVNVATNDRLLGTKPPTAEEVKQAFVKAIVASGYRIGDTTSAVIEREAPRIAATIQDLENVRHFVEKVNGVEHGFCYSLYSNDQIQRMGYFADGRRIGPWRYFFPDGTLATTLQYDADGEETGQHVQYYRNGNVHYVETYLDGVKHGPKTTFYEDGNTHIHQVWQRGKMHGIALIYYPNGILKKSASWASGQQHGTVRYYDQSGRITEQEQYIDGQER